ncbi:hypothetical protein OSB04_012088 [Centaurea solstitialis]|uniref:RRM domain-containing protein n=1 Tax=Centaurea solstitialis TaxID=347529 RepID=A0AA38TAQ4_9ASTR|nr:hypothetical protein OSB04_012088 [Centaurea solstitialis]
MNSRESNDWTEVRRRRREATLASTKRKDAAEVSQVRPKKKSLFSGKAITFYITNLADLVSEADIWKVFIRIGKIVDLYVAKKRNKQGCRFGFARFLGISDLKGFEGKLNNTWVGGQRLLANVARFKRDDRPISKPNCKDDSPNKEPPRRTYQATGFHKSFSEAVSGSKKVEDLVLDISIPGNAIDRMKANLIGKVSSLSKLWNVLDLKDADGCSDLNFRFLGGFYVMVEFKNSELAGNFLSNSKEIWENWFESLVFWTFDFVVNERLALLHIHGVPPHAWCTEVFNEIAKRFGQVVIEEDCLDDNFNLSVGKVGILTSCVNWLNRALKISLNGKLFNISVTEDLVNSISLLPSPANNVPGCNVPPTKETHQAENPSFSESSQFPGNFVPDTMDNQQSPGKPIQPGLNVQDPVPILDSGLGRPIPDGHVGSMEKNSLGCNPGLIRSSPPPSPFSGPVLSGRHNPSSDNHRKKNKRGRKLLFDLNKVAGSHFSHLVSRSSNHSSRRSRHSSSCETSVRVDSSTEVSNTMDIGNLVGFNMDGCSPEVRKLISKNGDKPVSR